jgi:hypothetical protein
MAKLPIAHIQVASATQKFLPVICGVAAVVFSVRPPGVSDRLRVYRGGSVAAMHAVARRQQPAARHPLRRAPGQPVWTVRLRDASCRQCGAGIEG